MKIIISYRSGEMRIINVTKEFFRSSELSIPKKVLDMAYDLGAEPYNIKVLRGGDVVHETHIPKYKPETFALPPKVNEKKVKKDLRNEFKNAGFQNKLVFKF